MKFDLSVKNKSAFITKAVISLLVVLVLFTCAGIINVTADEEELAYDAFGGGYAATGQLEGFLL